jgi:integrase
VWGDVWGGVSLAWKKRGVEMPEGRKRIPTKYPGVTYIETTGGDGKPERAYYVRYRLGGRNGKQVEEFVGYSRKDRMDALQASRIRGRRIQKEEAPNRERREAEQKAKEAEKARWTFARLWEEYKAQRPNLKGIVTDENRFQNYIRPNFGNKEPRDLTPFDVDRLRVSLLRKRTPATVRNVLELLRRIVNFGTIKNLCSPLPFRVEMPKVYNLRTEDLNPEQLSALLQTIEENPCDAGEMMRLALYSGMRRGEMFKLKWQDIDFDRGFIHIRDPKGGPAQVIPLNEMARGLLAGRVRISEFVFPGRKGQRVDVAKQTRHLKTLAGLPKDFRALHGLRHVYASMLASTGQVDMYTLQRLLTHKSPLMTQRYAHLRDEALRRASDLAGDIIRGANGHNSIRVVEEQTA